MRAMAWWALREEGLTDNGDEEEMLMSSTRFIGGIGDEELVGIVWGLVAGEGDSLVEGQVSRGDADAGQPYDVCLTYSTRLDGEDEDSVLTDTYEVDDYDIVPFDWGGDTSRILLAWRRLMLGRFGDEYATWHLLGRLEQAVEGFGKWNLDA